MKNIISNPEILGGKPVIEGTRISVEQILGLLSKGMTQNEIIKEYPELQLEDINAAVGYAANALTNDIIINIPLKKGA